MNIHTLQPTRNKTASPLNLTDVAGKFNPELTLNLKQFGRVKLRPIRADDEARMTRFHETLSEETIYLRYFEHISLDTRTLHERLTKVCTNTPDSYAIVAERQETSTYPSEIVAVGRLTTTEMPATASFAMLMGDSLLDGELPLALLKRLIEIARAHGFQILTGELLVADHDTLTICRSFGFELQTIPEDGLVRVSYIL
jgi:acetyltransferase